MGSATREEARASHLRSGRGEAGGHPFPERTAYHAAGPAPRRVRAGCSPEQIRTAVTALRGRRPRPLDDGAGRRDLPERVPTGSGGRTRTPNDRARTCCVADYTTPEGRRQDSPSPGRATKPTGPATESGAEPVRAVGPGQPGGGRASGPDRAGRSSRTTAARRGDPRPLRRAPA